MSMRVKELLAIGQKQLEECGIADAAIDSKLLYSFMMNVQKSRLVMEYQNILPDIQCDKYFELLDRRCAGEPLQYITGTQDFMGYTFQVNEDVLIPRQDTETLVENAISLIKEGKLAEGVKLSEGGIASDLELKKAPKDISEISCGESPKDYLKNQWSVLDLCTGSGAIGISIDKECRGVKVTCSDLSEKALRVAESNAANLGANISFAQGNLFEPFVKRFKKKIKFDMILSNPPYIKSGDISKLQVEIKDHEPMMALDGGEDGLDIVRKIISEAPDYMKDSGIIMIEIADDEMSEVLKLMREDGRYRDVKGIKDLAEKDRIAFAILK